MDTKIPFINPDFPPLEKVNVLFEQIYNNNFYTNNGPYYFEFKESLEKFFDNQLSACILANATLALILSLKALLPSDKKKVMVPSFTFSAGPLSIIWAGFEPVFIDIDESWQPNFIQASEYIINNHKDIAGILLCNTFGVGNNAIQDWEKISIDYDLPLIIDSAAGFGSYYSKDEKVGNRGDCEIFSLHATKPFGIGEGGLITSRSSKLINKIEEMKNFGFNIKHEVEWQGLNAKITEFSCAIGLLLLPNLDRKIQARQVLLKKYKKALEKYNFKFQPNDELSTVAFVSAVAPASVNRDNLIDKLKENNIESRAYYYPAVHNHPFFKNSKALSMEVTSIIENNIISLPADEKMSESSFDRIIEIIAKEYRKYKS